MPIYGYRCSQCGHELEVFQSMSAEPLSICPECSGPLRKLLYPVGVHFKGSGFYTTDYKNGGPSRSTSGSSTSGDSGGGESSSDAKSDSSSEKKSDSSADKKTESAPASKE
jgi:putative FmdB family regulatory protein